MATDGGSSFVRRSIHRISSRLRPRDLNQKKLGTFGAPQCRCTPLVLALCIALTGLILAGVGACMAAFMWNDDTPKGLGLAFVGLGVAMLIAGTALFIYDSYIRSLIPRDTISVYEPPVDGQAQRPQASQGTAPPPYDSILNQHTGRTPQQQSRNGARGASTSAV